MKTNILIRLSSIGGRIIFFLMGCVSSLFAQSVSPYQPLQPANLFDNPAQMSFDSRKVIRYQVMSLQAGVAATSATLGIAPNGNSIASLLREEVITDNPLSKGWGTIDLRGPAVSFSLPKMVTVSLLTRARVMGDYQNVNGKLMSEIGEVTKLAKTYPYTVEIEDMNTSLAAFSEMALGVAKPIFKTKQHQLGAGVTLKMLRSSGHTAIAIPRLDGTVDQYQNNDDLVYLTAATGQVNTLTSGIVLDDFTIKNLFSSLYTTWGTDLGLQYEWQSANTPYQKVAIGISVTDIGALKFAPETALSQSYAIAIAAPEKLFFNTHFDNADFSKTAEVYAKYPAFFSPQDRQESAYEVNLPTALKLHIKTQLTTSFAASLDINKGLVRSDKPYLAVLGWTRIIPEWNWKMHTIYAPFSYTSTKKRMVGIVYSYKGLTIGSHSFVSALYSSNRNVDFFVSITGKVPSR